MSRSLSEFMEDEGMGGMSPDYGIKWGNIAVGAAIGYAIGSEIRNLAEIAGSRRREYDFYTGKYSDED